MKILSNIYDFYYNMSEEERIALCYQWIAEEKRTFIYFPILLTQMGGWCNYNKQQGLLLVTPVMEFKDYKDKTKINKWFKIGAFSPDDLDMDLDFYVDSVDQGVELRAKIIDFLSNAIDHNPTTYREILEIIQLEFGGVLT